MEAKKGLRIIMEATKGLKDYNGGRKRVIRIIWMAKRG